MFSVRQPFALLMAMQENIPDGFSKVLAGIVSITFRYNVISNLQAAEQERTYSRVAIGISKGNLTSAYQVLGELRSIYPNDEIFRANFATKVFDTSNNRNKQIVRYILAKIDAQNTGSSFSWPSQEITVEHILPESPAENWPEFSDVEVTSEVYRIGNMILLENKLNRDAGNKPYSLKTKIYAKSHLGSAKHLCEKYNVWNVRAINERQSSLARLATGIWRVSQLH